MNIYSSTSAILAFPRKMKFRQVPMIILLSYQGAMILHCPCIAFFCVMALHLMYGVIGVIMVPAVVYMPLDA